MGAFGDRMRREREMRGVTLEEISESTKISKRALRALEEEEFDLLPGGIFNKGFVRSYARYLGIDEEQAVADFVAADAVNHQAEEEDKFPLKVEDRPAQPPLNPKRSATPIILALIILAVLAGGWTYWNKHKSQPSAHANDEAQDSTTVAPAGNSPTQAPSMNGPQTNANEAGTSANSDGKNDSVGPGSQTNSSAPSNSSQDSGPDSANSSTNDPTAKQSSTSDASSSSDLTSGAGQAFTVSIRANEDSWISVVADGKPKVEGILNAEKERSVTAGKELVLVTGNAGGIEVSYNGKPIAPLGRKQQKRTITFTPQGLKQ